MPKAKPPKNLEAFETIRVNRKQLKNAPYNPRKISESAEKKLRKFIKAQGFLQPAAIWNKRTRNIVGGHQRISQYDTLMKSGDYELTVCAVDLSPEDEVKANIQLNNPSMQGEWDTDALKEIKLSFPKIDFMADLGFDKLDLDFMFDDELPKAAPIDQMVEQNIGDILKIKEQKRKHKKESIAADKNGETEHIVEHDDYFVTIVFNTNSDKWAFMKKIQKKKDLKYIKAEDLDKLPPKKRATRFPRRA